MALGSRARAYLRGPEIGPPPPARAVTGAARLDRRTKNLVRRLKPGEIAVIDHADLDRIAAEDLVACGALAVVNVADSCSGTYPNSGPLVLANAGVRLIDVPGAALFDELSEGEQISVVGTEVRRNGSLLASGEVIDIATATEKLERQRELIDDALLAFAANTMEHARSEVELLSGKLDLPTVRTSFRSRHALIVVRGTTYRRDLQALRAYIEDTKPVLVGVDGGADAILEEGFVPDVVLGDMDSASDAVLGCGAELLVHAYRDGDAPGVERLERLGLDYVTVPAAGTSQDVAMLLAFEKGAELIVSVGAHFNLTEFLDKNRRGMSSTFLTRLRIGEILVDAKGVSRLYNPGVRGWQMWTFLAIALFLIVVVVLSSPALAEFFDLVWLKIKLALNL
jgi:uncharacterized membrane-anchored protein